MNQSWCFCVDYRKLNAITLQDRYLLPCIDESLIALAGTWYFSTLDLTSGCVQFHLDADAQAKSTFAARSCFWKCKVLSFGLKFAPPPFNIWWTPLENATTIPRRVDCDIEELRPSCCFSVATPFFCMLVSAAISTEFQNYFSCRFLLLVFWAIFCSNFWWLL